MRYYIKQGAIFDNPENDYDIDLFKTTVKMAGGKNVRTSYCYGWSNQPSVVTFDANYNLDLIECTLNQLSVFANSLMGCFILKKDW